MPLQIKMPVASGFAVVMPSANAKAASLNNEVSNNCPVRGRVAAAIQEGRATSPNSAEMYSAANWRERLSCLSSRESGARSTATRSRSRPAGAIGRAATCGGVLPTAAAVRDALDGIFAAIAASLASRIGVWS